MRAAFLVILIIALSGCAKEETFVSPVSYVPLISKQGIKSNKGVGATYSQCEYMEGAGWYYNWGVNLPDCGIESVPMLWDETFVGMSLGGTSTWLMGFNEPELSSQANLTPNEAAVLWREVEILYPDKNLVSPSVLYISWLTEWYDEYIGMYGASPKINAVGIHCYGDTLASRSVSKCKGVFRDAVNWAESRNIYQVWVTEYAHLPCWSEGVQGSIYFMTAMREYFDSEPSITRDAWFQLSYRGDEPWACGPRCNTSLVDYYTGEQTALGNAY